MVLYRYSCGARFSGRREGLSGAKGLGLAWVFLSLLAGWSQPLCSNELVRVHPAERGNRVDFYLDNLQTAEVTVTFSVTSLNVRGSESFPHTLTAPGEVRDLKVFTLWPVNPVSRWSYQYQFWSTLGNFKARHDTNHLYLLPFAREGEFKVIQGFNGRLSHFGDSQYAIDWRMPEGTPVHAARKGVVAAVKEDSQQGGPEKKYEPCANAVWIQHDDGTIGQYAHLRHQGAEVRPGQLVRAGDLIGYSGNTGYSHGPHLHFDVFRAKDGQGRESLPIHFLTREGKGIVLRQGQVCRHPQ